MYSKDSTPQNENTNYSPVGRKSIIRSRMAELIVSEMEMGRLKAVIYRAPEFYGPGNTQSITNTLVLNKVKSNATAIFPVNKDTSRTLIWTPDP